MHAIAGKRNHLINFIKYTDIKNILEITHLVTIGLLPNQS